MWNCAPSSKILPSDDRRKEHGDWYNPCHEYNSQDLNLTRSNNSNWLSRHEFDLFSAEALFGKYCTVLSGLPCCSYPFYFQLSNSKSVSDSTAMVCYSRSLASHSRVTLRVFVRRRCKTKFDADQVIDRPTTQVNLHIYRYIGHVSKKSEAVAVMQAVHSSRARKVDTSL